MRPRTLFLFCFFLVPIMALISESIGQIRIKDTSQSLSIVSAGIGFRSEAYSVSWNGEDVLPSQDTTFIGIRSLDVQSLTIDFEIAFSSASYTGDAASVDFIMTVNSACMIGLIEHFILVTADPRVHLINYDFGADAAFVSTFSTGTDAELSYTIPYTPAVPDLFTTGATAYVSFTSVKISLSTSYMFDYEIVQVTSSSLTMKIRKYADTVLDALKGQILIISSDAVDDLGFATTTITSPSFSAGVTTQTAESTLTAISSYYGAPEMAFFLKKWNFASLISFRSEGELSTDGTDFKPFLAVTQLSTAEIQGLDYMVLTFCKQGNDCKTSGFVPEVIAGEANIQTFIGTTLATADSSVRSFEFNIAFKRFLGTPPTNYAVGVISGDSTWGFSVSVSAITESSITINVAAPVNVAITKLKVSYIASNWDGLQIIDTPFTQPAPSGPAGTTTVFTQDVTYVPSSSITTPEAFVIFSVINVDIPTSPIILYSERDSLYSTTFVRMKITLSADLTFSNFRGFVIIYETPSLNANKMDTKLSTFAPTSSYIETSTATTLNYPYAPFVFNYINKFSMPCGALTLDAYQKYYLAASACQMAWTYGAADSCTGSGFTYQIFSFPSYAVSSSGIDYSVFQGTGDICVEATFGGSDELAVVVTDDAKWNGIFKFTKTMRSVPRFLQTHIQTVSSSGTFAHLTVPVSTFPATGFFTFSILKLTPVSLVWNLAGYTGDYMHDFHNPSALNTPEVKNGNFAYGGTDLAQAIGQYQTVVATKFVKHDQTNAFSCQVGVTFKGVIRALYVDSKFILAGSSGDASVSITLNSEVNADFSPNVGSVSTAATVTILGHYLKITTLSFSSCSDGVNSVTPTFTNYVHDLTYAGSQLYYWKVTDTACGSGCLSCLDTTTCFECDSSHFLLGTNCVYNCNDPTYFVAAKDKYCRSTFANQGLTRTIPSYSGGAITFDVVVNPFRYAFGVFTLIYPKGISIVNYPIIVHDNTKPIALVEGSMKGTIVSTAVQEPLFNAQTVNVVNVATALNQDVRLVTISVYPDFYYYFTVLSGGPQLIGYRQSTPYGNSISMSVSDVYQAHVIIDAPSGGELTVEFLGQLEVLLNHVTVIFSATFATQTSYTLVKSLPTGISYLTFKGTGSTYFDFSIVGSGIKTYNPVSFLHEETLTIPVSTATAISNCLNGAAPVCRSCIGTYYLSPDESECNSNCDSVGGTPVAEERLCDGVVVTPGPGTTANPTKLPVPKAVEVFQSVDETRKISNEVFSVVSSIGFQGVHSIRSQTVQGPLGYFMFINIKFPWNYIQFAAKNQDSNMPNPWGKDDNKDNEDIDEAYENQSNIDAFLEDQTLAVNIGETMIYLLVCVLIIPVYEGIVWLLVRYKKPETPTKWYHSVLEKGSKSLRWSFLMNQFISKYQDITFFVFLGIYNAGRGENTDAGNTVGSVLGFILVVSVVVGLFFLIKEIQKALKDYDEEQIEKEKFKDNDYLIRRLILFKDFKKDKLITLLYTFFAVLRVFGFCFCVIFISSVVGIQLAFLNISSFLIIFYLLYYKPFDETVQLRLTLVYEFVFYAGVLAATILQIYMSAGGHDETTKTGFGYAIIAADVGMTVLNFISFYMEIKEYAEVTYEYLKLSYKKVRNKKKVIPLPAEGEKRSVKNENLKTEDGSPGLAELGKASSKLGNGDVTSQDLLSPSTSMSKLVFPSSINDPKRPSLRDRTRHSLMREQVFSIIEAKEENDILIDGSNIKSPKDFDSTRLHVNHGWDSPDGKNRRKRLSKRDARLSISTDKDTAELIGPQGGDNGDNGDVEITKLV